MSDDKLMDALIRTARRREQQDAARSDEGWENLSEGRSVGVRSGAPGDPELLDADSERMREVYRPLGQDFRAALVERVWEELGSAESAAAAQPATASGDVASGDPAMHAPATHAGKKTATTAQVLALKPRLASRRTWVSLALAASLLLAVVAVMNLGPGGSAVSFPAYALSLDGGLTRMRSSAGTSTDVAGAGVPQEYAPGNQFRLLLTPEEAVDGPIAVRVYVDQGGSFELLATPQPKISAKGAVSIDGDVGADVRLPAGRSSLIVIVGRPDALPDSAALRAAIAAASEDRLQGAGWVGWRTGVSLNNP